MKICILTVHHVPNMGSLLQSYGLKSLLEDCGHKVSFLNIEPNADDDRLLGRRECYFLSEMEKKGVLAKIKKLDKYWINRIRIKLANNRQNQIFDSFRSSILGIDGKANAQFFDCCVIGSDEVLNCLAGESWGFTSQLFGNVRQAAKVITYAASCGSTKYEDVPEAVRERIRDVFQGVSAFSVRDANTMEFVSRLSEKSVQIHFDPVIVGNFEREISTARLPQNMPSRYCIVYSYYNRIHNKNEIQGIVQFCAKHDMEIVAIGAPQMWIKKYLVLTPFEALKAFQNAEFVVTDTFHGTIFSAKYAKRFATIIRQSNENKLRDLISRLHLEGHVINSIDGLEDAFSIKNDPERMTGLAETEREKTIRYFTERLQ